MESQGTRPAKNRRIEGSFQQIETEEGEHRKEMECGPLTSQRGRLVFHLDAVSSTVQAERNSRGTPRQAGDNTDCTLLHLQHTFLHRNFFSPLLIPPVTLFWAETPRPAPPPPSLPALTDLMCVFPRGRGASASKTKHLTFNCFGFTIQRRKVVSPQEGNSL